jgi:hypothetical protein
VTGSAHADTTEAAPAVGRVTRDFLLGGSATFTVSTGDREYRFHVRRPRPGRKWRGDTFRWFIFQRPKRRYIGEMNPCEPEVLLTYSSRLAPTHRIVRALETALDHAWYGTPLLDGWRVQTDGRCGACNRPMAEPESIERGFGPVCWRKRTAPLARAA